MLLLSSSSTSSATDLMRRAGLGQQLAEAGLAAGARVHLDDLLVRQHQPVVVGRGALLAKEQLGRAQAHGVGAVGQDVAQDQVHHLVDEDGRNGDASPGASAAGRRPRWCRRASAGRDRPAPPGSSPPPPRQQARRGAPARPGATDRPSAPRAGAPRPRTRCRSGASRDACSRRAGTSGVTCSQPSAPRSSRCMPADFQNSRFVIDHRPDLGVQRLARGRANGSELLLDLAVRIPGAPHGEDRVDGRVAAQVERRTRASSLAADSATSSPGAACADDEMHGQCAARSPRGPIASPRQRWRRSTGRSSVSRGSRWRRPAWSCRRSSRGRGRRRRRRPRPPIPPAPPPARTRARRRHRSGWS